MHTQSGDMVQSVDDDIQVHFESNALAYSRFVAPCFRATHDYLCTYASKLSVGSILDVACGDGSLAARLANTVSCSVVGVDRSRSLIAIATRRSPTMRWLVADAHALPFNTGSFALVLSNLSLHLFQDPPAAVREMCRVATPEGEIVLGLLRSIRPESVEDSGDATRSRRLDHAFRVSGVEIRSREVIRDVIVIRDRETLGNLLAGEVLPTGGIIRTSEQALALAGLMLGRYSGAVKLLFEFEMVHLAAKKPAKTMAPLKPTRFR